MKLKIQHCHEAIDVRKSIDIGNPFPVAGRIHAMFRIAHAAGFPADRPETARQILDQVEIDYLIFQFLSEATMADLAIQRAADPARGHVSEFQAMIQSLCPLIFLQPQWKIITNAGGMNPRTCVESVSAILSENGSPNLAIGVIFGDDLFGRLEELIAAGCSFDNINTGEPLDQLKRPIVAANAIFGGEPIAKALDDGARLVLSGLVGGESLAVGPSLHSIHGTSNNLNLIASAAVVGHLIQGGACVTCGKGTSWSDFNLTNIGYPIAEFDEDGTAVITKPPGMDGVVTRQTVVEQLLNGIGDPAHFQTPDVEVDLTTVQVTECRPNQVRVQNATGRMAPATYPVSMIYHTGFAATGEFLVWGNDCIQKAQAVAEILFARLKAAGWVFETKLVEMLGPGTSISKNNGPRGKPCEMVLRVTVQSPIREAVERFAREIPPLPLTGPTGIAPWNGKIARPPIHPVVAVWPTQVPKDAVEPIVEVRTAQEWE
ncbi:MAG: DUF1446 domain-containing protein [Pirellulales bacterium]|nr:DUF1446 domain-containing protein [Pirellulales bacterium]